jgi:hypothetical protein
MRSFTSRLTLWANWPQELGAERGFAAVAKGVPAARPRGSESSTSRHSQDNPHVKLKERKPHIY